MHKDGVWVSYTSSLPVRKALKELGFSQSTTKSVHEVRAFRERKKRSLRFRELVENCVVYGDRGYRGCEGVIVCGSREMRANRQVVEGVISQLKLFNAGSGWRTLTCVLVYTYAYAIGYSYYRRVILLLCIPITENRTIAYMPVQ